MCINDIGLKHTLISNLDLMKDLFCPSVNANPVFLWMTN